MPYSIGTQGSNSLITDGDWHCVEQRYKMNTHNGISFNNDGVWQLWIDGVLKATFVVPWNQNGAPSSPIRGFRAVLIGGNNNNYWASSGTITEREQWYAIDDIVISTTYIGPGPATDTGPVAPKNVHIN